MLLLVRHGETATNVAGLLLGRADPPLTELGRRQASALAAAVPTPTRLISSPLARARDTAAAFGAAHAIAIEMDERWIELDYGTLDGRPVAEVSASVWDRWRRDVDYSPGGAESVRKLGARVREACLALAEAATAGVVVVVTHVSPVKAAIAWALDVPDEVAWRMYVEDAGLARIDFGPYGPVLRWFNRHAAPLA